MRTFNPEYIHGSTVRRLNLALWKSGETDIKAANNEDGMITVHKLESGKLVLMDCISEADASKFAADLERSLKIRLALMADTTTAR
ncbi:MAG: hypothetical protein JRN21_09300 [Nitrososphaerota archaeon]|nr:hypothetical protein [Nitrososphaerota archaeon]